ncbi:MAG: patatin family protein [Acutalibacteraceae bacterium]
MYNAGLVLEGGALRGLFTAGALDFLMEQDISFKYIVSVSAGTCNAYSYISGQKGRTKACMFPEKEEDFWMGPKQALHSHRLMDLQKIFFEYPYKQFPFRFDKYFESETINDVVMTSLESGKAQYMREKQSEERLSLIGSASCALPIIAKSIKIDGKTYFDGGIADSIPFRRAKEQGYDKIFVILTRPRNKFPTISNKSARLYKTLFHNHKEFLSTLLNRENVYKKQIRELSDLENTGKAFVIRPTIPEIDRMEKDENKKEKFYQHGYDTMKENFDRLINYLEK